MANDNIFGSKRLFNLSPLRKRGTVDYAITCIFLTQVGCNAIDKQLNALFITQTLADACWLLRYIRALCENIFGWEVPNVF
jgi:hypothetical protein